MTASGGDSGEKPQNEGAQGPSEGSYEAPPIEQSPVSSGYDAPLAPPDAPAYTGRLKITVSNQPGSLSSLSTVIARHEGNISNLRIVNRSMDFFDMVIDVEVTDVKHLADITAALRATPAINAVERARN